jgi:hypothetical protein
MTAHELAYCQYLLREIRGLCVENEAMSTLLANRNFSGEPWRDAVEKLCADGVFRSAVAANFDPYFSRLKRAMSDVDTLAELVQTPSPNHDPGDKEV